MTSAATDTVANDAEVTIIYTVTVAVSISNIITMNSNVPTTVAFYVTAVHTIDVAVTNDVDGATTVDVAAIITYASSANVSTTIGATNATTPKLPLRCFYFYYCCYCCLCFCFFFLRFY